MNDEDFENKVAATWDKLERSIEEKYDSHLLITGILAAIAGILIFIVIASIWIILF